MNLASLVFWMLLAGAAEVQLFSTARPDPANKNAISIGPPFTLKLKVWESTAWSHAV